MNTLPVKTIYDAIITMLVEAYDGPPNEKETWFIDNEPDSGILGILAKLSAAEASKSVDGSGAPGSTIASNAEHLRWAMANDNASLRGEPLKTNWSESWALNAADEAGWERLRADLRKEYETLRGLLQQQQELPPQYMTGLAAIVAHSAFHLGLIRQMAERVLKAP